MLILRRRLDITRVLPTAAARSLVWLEAALAAAAFAALCTVVLSVAPQLGVEPDDGAYRASIVAMTEGDFLTLSALRSEALAGTLGDGPGAPRTSGSS